MRKSFAWDGDLYGWDEAVVYVREPVAVITTKRPERRFDYWYMGTVMENVLWLKVKEGRLWGARKERTVREDVVKWDVNAWENMEGADFVGGSVEEQSDMLVAEKSSL